MKKMYESPVAEKVDFDYEDNVVASGPATTESSTKCTCSSCKQSSGKDYGYGWGWGWGWSWTLFWPRSWGGRC